MQHPSEGARSLRVPQQKRRTLMNRTLITLALIAAAGVAHAQMQAPRTPGGRAMDSMPGGTSNPNTALPKTPSNPTSAQAPAKPQLGAKGYIRRKRLPH